MSTDLFISALIGYFAGSIPFGLLITRFAGYGDVRMIGSGNIGATNVLRTGNKFLAALTLTADCIKGLLPVLVASSLYGLVTAGLLAGFAALIGHMFPLWLKFRGGKGVATLIGTAFGFYWPAGVVFIIVWLMIAYAFRYSSLSALVACLVTPVFAFLNTDVLIAIILFLMSILVIMRHSGNAVRLIAGEEDKIGQKPTD